MKQLLFVIISLFRKIASYASYCIRTILNFVVLTIYIVHDEKTLNYLYHVIYRINKFKYVFKKYRSHENIENELIEKKNNEKKNVFKCHFNIFKWHIITHYENFIRFYDNVQKYDICYNEIIHKFFLKFFFFQRTKTWITKYKFWIIIYDEQTWLS